MHLNSRLSRTRVACERGFTTVALMGVLMIGGLLVVAGFAAVDPDISLSREDQDKKQAYGAAESGLQWYLNALSKDNNYYLKCTQVPPPNPQEAAPVQPFQLRSDLGHADGRFVMLAAHRLSSISAGTVTIIDFSVRGWITTSATWTRTKATMPNMMARWMPRAIG